MKRMLVAGFVLALVSAAFAQTSKEFIFFGEVLDALKFCQSSIQYRVTSKTPPKKMIEDTEQANVSLERARQILDKYTRNQEPPIADCAIAILNGVDILIYSNDVLIGKLEGVAGLHPNGFENTEFETARFRSQSKRGWNEFFGALATLSSLITRPAVGQDAFKMPAEERQQLLAKIEQLFKQEESSSDESPAGNILEEEKQDLRVRFASSITAIKDLLLSEAR